MKTLLLTGGFALLKFVIKPDFNQYLLAYEFLMQDELKTYVFDSQNEEY